MTYCLSMLCKEGLVCLSDSRTSAGVDNVRVQSKMRVHSTSDQVICLMTSGNLSITQTVMSLVEEDLLKGKVSTESAHLLNQPTLFEVARYLGDKIREVEKTDREALEVSGLRFNINILVSGQIRGQEHQIFQVYPQGNSIHGTPDSPFLQIGEYKYGKPILDRGFTCETTLKDAVKFGVLSLETTMRSNVSVGTPFDIFCYEKDSFTIRHRMRLNDSDPYLIQVREQWQRGIIRLVNEMPSVNFAVENGGLV